MNGLGEPGLQPYQHFCLETEEALLLVPLGFFFFFKSLLFIKLNRYRYLL